MFRILWQHTSIYRKMNYYFFAILIVCHVHLRFVTSIDAQFKDDDSENSTQQSFEVPNWIDHTKLPTILIVTLFRNKAHIMPLFFYIFESYRISKG